MHPVRDVAFCEHQTHADEQRTALPDPRPRVGEGRQGAQAPRTGLGAVVARYHSVRYEQDPERCAANEPEAVRAIAHGGDGTERMAD